MKRYIVLSCNDNPDYQFYIPLCLWAWKYFGWEPFIFVDGISRSAAIWKLIAPYLSVQERVILAVPGNVYRSDTITQVSRLYAGCFMEPDSMLMTGDVDMIPLSDYWHPDPSKITIYGHDLTDYTEYPICYLAMTRERWVEVMNLTSTDYNALIKRDLDLWPNAKSTDFYTFWGVDQQIATQRIKSVNFDKEFINRGKYASGYAKGRVDRGDWKLDHEQYIDCHLHRDLYKTFKKGADPLYHKKWEQHLQMLNRVWPNENFDWFHDYSKQFAKLC